MKKSRLYNVYQDDIDGEDDASDSKVDANDDEEIDEECVFNGSDEERFGAYFPGKEADEDDQEDEDDDDQEGVDLSDLLKREQLQDLIHVNDNETLEEFSESESDGSVADLSNIFSRKRKVVDLNPGKHGEFSIPLGGKVSLSDMMASVQEETSFGALKKRLKNLENTVKINAPAATRIKNR
jgi:hypothetical protein